MPRSHLWGCLGPLLFAIAVGTVALSSIGLPMAIFLSLFGVDPFTSIFMVLMTDRGSLAGVTGAATGALAMWVAHVFDRRMSWPWWVATGLAGYAVGALGIHLFVQIHPPESA